MSLRLLSDQCVPSGITRRLVDAGHEVALLRDVLPIRAPDRHVIAKAQELDAILVSLNGDFADLIAYPPSQFGGIIAIQLHNHPEIIPFVMARLVRFLDSHPE